MAITKVRVKVNGTWTNLSQDSTTGKWTGSITAPAATSYNMSGGYYSVMIEATNDAGTVKTWEATDAAWGHALKLVVRELLKPVIALVTPSNGAYVTNNKQAFTFKVTDESGGSGVKLSEVKLEIDGITYDCDSNQMTYSQITNGYQFVYTPETALTDGSHTVIINAADNDGNAAATVTALFTVDTVPPTLNVVTPTEELITNNASLTVSGTTNDVTTSPVTVAIALNNEEQGTISVGSDGAFSKTLTLVEGINTIVITATDAAGKSSSVTRSVKLDTTIPAINSMTMIPNPVDTSSSVTITIEVI